MTRERYTLELPTELDRQVRAACDRAGCTKSEFMRKAVALMLACDEAARAGQFVGTAAKASDLKTRFVGL